MDVAAVRGRLGDFGAAGGSLELISPGLVSRTVLQAISDALFASCTSSRGRWMIRGSAEQASAYGRRAGMAVARIDDVIIGTACILERDSGSLEITRLGSTGRLLGTGTALVAGAACLAHRVRQALVVTPIWESTPFYAGLGAHCGMVGSTEMNWAPTDLATLAALVIDLCRPAVLIP